jgi:hypothetical protein
MKKYWLLGAILYGFSSFALGSSCDVVNEKMLRILNSNLSDGETGRAVKEVLYQEEKNISAQLLDEVKKRALEMAKGDNARQQRLLTEPFMGALVFCRENPELSFSGAFQKAFAVLRRKDEGQN